MKKLLVMVLIVVIVASSMVALTPRPAQAKYYFCEVAATFGWHAWWANIACLIERAADINGSGGGDPW